MIGLVVHAVGLSGNLPQMIKLQMTLEIEEEQKKDTARGFRTFFTNFCPEFDYFRHFVSRFIIGNLFIQQCVS